MATPVVFLHGWSGDRGSYGKLPELLAGRGHEVSHIFLGRYATGDNDLTIDDFAIRLEDVVRTGHRFATPFDLVVHSTGAVVARRWLSRFYAVDAPSPVRRFVMAAPANNGSRLASWGDKVPWDWGNRVLDALELGSRLTWDLNWEWMSTGRAQRMAGLEMWHLQGTNRDLGLGNLLDVPDELFGLNVPSFEERGSDNTVRFCAANLNMKGVRLRPGQKMDAAVVEEIRGIPVHVFPDRSHFGEKHGILSSIQSANHAVFRDVEAILNAHPPPVPDAMQAGIPGAAGEYLMLNVRVVDQLGNPHAGFLPNFYYGSGGERKKLTVEHRRQKDEIQCFYLRAKDGLDGLTKFGFGLPGNRSGKTEWAPSALIDLHWPERGLRFLEMGKTHFVEVAVEKSLTPEAMDFLPLG